MVQPNGEDQSQQEEEREQKGGRRPRGTAGTFNGKRPPKDEAKLKLFLVQKGIHDKEVAAKKAEKKAAAGAKQTVISERRAVYLKFMQEFLKGNNSPEAFAAISEYHIVMKRPSAAESSGVLATPDKEQAASTDGETPEKDLQTAGSSSSSSSNNGQKTA